jgi:hypothetical protein
MATRRSVLVGAVAGLTATAGCLEFALGAAPLEAEADEATVADRALAETGYEVSRSDWTERPYAVTVAGRSREIEATCYVSEYRKRLSVGTIEEEYLGTFGLVGAPRTELFGRSSHPLEGSSDRRLAVDLQSEYERLEAVERVGTDAVRTLGARHEVAVHRAEAVRSSESIDVSVHALSFDHGEDHLVGVGVHPTSLTGERQRIRTLFEHVEHG